MLIKGGNPDKVSQKKSSYVGAISNWNFLFSAQRSRRILSCPNKRTGVVKCTNMLQEYDGTDFLEEDKL